MLIALYPVPQQLSQLADTVQRSYTQYANLVQLRRPLKSTFVLILTFVVLMSLIAAVYGAFFAAQRLVQPVQDLIAGTRAVAKGNYDTQAAAALARRARLSRDLVQRHDQAPGPRARGNAAQPASGGSRARRARRDSGAPVDGRGVARGRT